MGLAPTTSTTMQMALGDALAVALLKRRGFTEADFRRLEDIRFAFHEIDGVFHVGALPRVPLSIEQPVLTSEVNIMGTLNVLMAAREAGVKRVVYSASSSAYGDQDMLPMRPDMRPNPLNPYALQKYVGELWMKQFAALYGLETVSLRYFNVYGPRMANDGAYVTVIAIFLREKKPANRCRSTATARKRAILRT